MKMLLADISSRHQMLLRQVGWALLIVMFLASLPFLFNLVNSGIDRITTLFPHSPRSWEAPLWFL
jgi:hypothetical protein